MSDYPTCRERNTREIMMMYETSFATLSDKFFKNSSWPPVEYIEGLVDHDHVFCLLYKVSKHVLLDLFSNCCNLDEKKYMSLRGITHEAVLPCAGNVLQAFVCQHTAHLSPAL